MNTVKVAKPSGTKPQEEQKAGLCPWINRGLKSTPYWYVATCNGRIVNIKKQMQKRGTFMEKCPFCYKAIDWRRKK